MPLLSEAVVFWVAVAAQLAGVSSVVVARSSRASWGSALVQRLFFACLIAVGLSTMLALHLQQGLWLSGAAILGGMAVGATWETGSSRPAAAPEC